MALVLKKNIKKKTTTNFSQRTMLLLYILKQLKELMRARARPHFVQGFLGFKGGVFRGERWRFSG